MDHLWTCLAKCFMEVNAPLRFPSSCSFIPLLPVKDLVFVAPRADPRVLRAPISQPSGRRGREEVGNVSWKSPSLCPGPPCRGTWVSQRSSQETRQVLQGIPL